MARPKKNVQTEKNITQGPTAAQQEAVADVLAQEAKTEETVVDTNEASVQEPIAEQQVQPV